MINTTEIAPDIYRISFIDEEDLGDIAFPGLSYNMFLFNGSEPAILDTMFRRTFSRMSAEVANILYPTLLKYVIVSHHCGDTSGALNEWLIQAPDAMALCSGTCAILSLNDYASRPPRIVEDEEVLVLGKHRLRFLMTPHVDQWDSLMVYEEKTGTLFSNDLFSTPGAEVVTGADLSGIALGLAQQARYQADDRSHLTEALSKIAKLDVQMVAPMHGPAQRGHLTNLLGVFQTQALQPAALA